MFHYPSHSYLSLPLSATLQTSPNTIIWRFYLLNFFYLFFFQGISCCRSVHNKFNHRSLQFLLHFVHVNIGLYIILYIQTHTTHHRPQTEGAFVTLWFCNLTDDLHHTTSIRTYLFSPPPPPMCEDVSAKISRQAFLCSVCNSCYSMSIPPPPKGYVGICAIWKGQKHNLRQALNSYQTINRASINQCLVLHCTERNS